MVTMTRQPELRRNRVFDTSWPGYVRILNLIMQGTLPYSAKRCDSCLNDPLVSSLNPVLVVFLLMAGTYRCCSV